MGTSAPLCRFLLQRPHFCGAAVRPCAPCAACALQMPPTFNSWVLAEDMLLFHRRALQQQLEQTYVALGLAAAAGRAFVLPEVRPVAAAANCANCGGRRQAPWPGAASTRRPNPFCSTCQQYSRLPLQFWVSLLMQRCARAKPLPRHPAHTPAPAVLLLLPEQRDGPAALPAARQRGGRVSGALPRGRGAATAGQVWGADGRGHAAARAAARYAAQHGDGRGTLPLLWLWAWRASGCLRCGTAWMSRHAALGVCSCGGAGRLPASLTACRCRPQRRSLLRDRQLRTALCLSCATSGLLCLPLAGPAEQGAGAEAFGHHPVASLLDQRRPNQAGGLRGGGPGRRAPSADLAAPAG